jgi:hypothetical protein
MTHPHPRALEAAARALADYRYLNFERNSDFLVAHARAAVTAYLAEAGDGWMPIESAPKDGTWFQAYRPAPKVGVCQRVVTMRWLASEDDFAWPVDVFDEYNPPDIEAKDRRGFYVDVYTGGSTFTHWRPLPAPPAAQEPRP